MTEKYQVQKKTTETNRCLTCRKFIKRDESYCKKHDKPSQDPINQGNAGE